METNASSDHRRYCNNRLDRRRSYLRRFQLLRYRDVARLCDVMETVVPIHGTGNFPTLEIRPSELVQLVRARLEEIGVKVRDIRLNGSAATHVLSDDTTHKYKDLDLIFAIDFPKQKSGTTSVSNTSPYNSNSDGIDGEDLLKNKSVEPRSHINERPTCLPSNSRRRTQTKGFLEDASLVEDSGYTSSGSSEVSAPASPSCITSPLIQKKCNSASLRTRTCSIESMSSTSSLHNLHPLIRDETFSMHFQSHPAIYHQKDRCWQEVKDAAMQTLLEFFPEHASRSKMNSVVLGSAYVEKMVKVANDSDKWSLISFNNNEGRNLEFKFVQSMKRQFEFSVDSFQIVLDTYLEFCKAARQNEEMPVVQMTEKFHPTVIAESVYGDFAAALRHLRERRICTHRPEEIRGGGLLRYCNLLVREFKPGDVTKDTDSSDFGDRSSRKSTSDFSSSDPDEIERLEQHMCSRFFIDFNDIERQQKKLISYLNNHFAGEEDLKFQYLLVLRRVVDTRTVCLMQHERTMILDAITMLVRQTLANNVAKDSQEQMQMQQRIQQDYYYTTQKKSFAKNDNTHSTGLQYVHNDHTLNPPRPMSDRSSPISSYSSPMAPTPSSSPAEMYSAPNSPSPYSRPLTPNTGAYRPSSPGVCFMEGNQRGYQPPTAAYQPPLPYCNCCCGCCCCRRRQQGDPYYHLAYYQQACQTPYPNSPINPIYYSPGSMTCYYQPAQYVQQDI
ncbi:uncharacterized protein LOC143464865 [Clavelina lepadiformis]|uniref:uncharacterized protein LOC143464865 n=1 Tax=Clavelina lepadiformis TaxID=159417 RepID=UPI004042DBC6